MLDGKKRIGVQVDEGIIDKVKCDGLLLVQFKRFDDFGLGGLGFFQGVVLQFEGDLIGLDVC